MTVCAIFVAAPPGINRLFEQIPAAHEKANPLGGSGAMTKLIDCFVYARLISGLMAITPLIWPIHMDAPITLDVVRPPEFIPETFAGPSVVGHM